MGFHSQQSQILGVFPVAHTTNIPFSIATNEEIAIQLSCNISELGIEIDTEITSTPSSMTWSTTTRMSGLVTMSSSQRTLYTTNMARGAIPFTVHST